MFTVYDNNLGTEIIDEIFTNEVIEALHNVTYAIISDNSIKQNKIKSILREIGFVEFRTGTNRLAGFHPSYPSCAFKFAIDKRGVEDNLADIELSQDMDLVRYITGIYECIGHIEVAEKVREFRSSSEFEPHKGAAAKILMKIQETHLPDDISLHQFLNWGYSDMQGKPVVLDFAYLVRIEDVDLQCDSLKTGYICNGDLVYNDTVSELVCSKCGAIHTFSSVKMKMMEAADNNSVFSSNTSFDCGDDDDAFLV